MRSLSALQESRCLKLKCRKQPSRIDVKAVKPGQVR